MKSRFDKTNPVLRILFSTIISVLTAVIKDDKLLLVMLILSAVTAGLSGLKFSFYRKKLLAVNFFALFIFVLTPINSGGRVLIDLSLFNYSYNGFYISYLLFLKANSILLIVSTFIASLEPPVLGHSLKKLGLGNTFCDMLLMTLRYIGVMETELKKLNNAAKLRGFVPGMNFHTYKTYAYMTGMLLLRSLEKAEHINNAMKCRCYNGKFYTPEFAYYKKADIIFSSISVSVITLLLITLFQGRIFWNL